MAGGSRKKSRARRRSTREWTCRPENCLDLAALLGVEAEVARRAFLGEPMLRVVAIVEEALQAEADARERGESFYAGSFIAGWAHNHRAGYWRPPEKRTPLQVAEYGKS